MEHVEVKICVGTLCSVMGGSDLQLLDEHIPEEWESRVKIVGSTCLQLCHDEQHGGKPPYATVNGECVSSATINSILERIEVQLRK